MCLSMENMSQRAKLLSLKKFRCSNHGNCQCFKNRRKVETDMTNVLLTGSLESFIQLLGALFIFAVVLAATYLTTRWMGGMQRGRQNNKNLHVIETISVGNNKMISIVEAGSVYLVVSVGKEEVHLLAQLTRDQLKDFSFELEQSGKKQDSFAEILNQLKDKLPKKQG
mgnify:CR=1 FL=1